jgi:DegV family protein with EDD domain
MADGGADIPKHLIDRSQITIIPLYLHFSDEQQRSDLSVNLTEFLQKIKDKKELPRSAAPSPNDFYHAFKGVDASKPILMLSLSHGLSSTYENAIAGKSMLLEEYPNRTIEVINTKTASCGIALLLQEATDQLEAGYTFHSLVEHLHNCVERMTTLFILKTLENLILGGRLDKVKGTIAKTLNIKLLMKGNNAGEIEVSEKVRGDKKSIRRFIEQIEQYTTHFEDKVISISHCNAEARAKNVLDEICNKYAFKDALLTETGPLISTYGGEGALVVSFFKDKE